MQLLTDEATYSFLCKLLSVALINTKYAKENRKKTRSQSYQCATIYICNAQKTNVAMHIDMYDITYLCLFIQAVCESH